MKTRLVLLIMLLAASLVLGAAQAMAQPPFAPITGNVNVFIGGKSMDSADWGQVDEQSELGVMLDIKEESWPISLAVNLLGSSDVERDRIYDTFGSTLETQLGVKKIFELGEVTNIAIAGGAAIISGDIERRYDYPYRFRETDSETEIGPWASLGIYWRLAWINVGIEGKWSQANMRLLGRDVDAGGGHFGVIIGYSWGSPHFPIVVPTHGPPPGPRPY